MSSEQDHEALQAAFRAAIAPLGLLAEGAPPGRAESTSSRRARGPRARTTAAERIVLSVVDQDGVLVVEEGAPRPRNGSAGRRSARALGLGGDVVEHFELKRLERSKVGAALEALDDRLTPTRGLRRLSQGALVPCPKPRKSGRILLIVHGTFSTCDHLVDELRAGDPSFLGRLEQSYDQVLTFDHPTLSVSPVLNARQLALLLQGSRAEVDVVCHSRGGLVVRWWTEVFDPRPRRVVFVGSPLAGTALAAPPNLRSSLSMLLNLANVLGKSAGLAATAAPLFAVVAGVFQVVSSVTSLLAKTPAIDAAVALIPGLAAMSRVGNNAELLSLRAGAAASFEEYAVVQSNFEPDDPAWKFWRHLRPTNVADRLLDTVFAGTNDLVVDTESMADLQDGLRVAREARLDFGTSSEVHHLNYFRQRKTQEFMAKRFGL